MAELKAQAEAASEDRDSELMKQKILHKILALKKEELTEE